MIQFLEGREWSGGLILAVAGADRRGAVAGDLTKSPVAWLGASATVSSGEEVKWDILSKGHAEGGDTLERDRRLQGLSEEHQHGLALAQRARWAAAGERGLQPEEIWQEIMGAYDAELARHFEVEERILLPALIEAGEAELVERVLDDHKAMRSMLGEEGGDLGDRLRRFGERLHAHIRFEERELFPVCEKVLPDEVLDGVATATPKLPRRST